MTDLDKIRLVEGVLEVGKSIPMLINHVKGLWRPKMSQKIDDLEPPNPGAPKLVFAISRVYIDRFEHTFFFCFLVFLAMRNRLKPLGIIYDLIWGS